MRTITHIITIFLFCSISILSDAAPLRYTVTHYSTEDGLSQNTVMYMKQDSRGVMWLATWDGLNAFDGYHFSVFKALAGDHVNLSNNRIETIDTDPYGYIWVLAYDYRAHRFDPRTQHFEPILIPGHESLNIKKITILKSGNIWLLGENDEAIRITTDSTTHHINTALYSALSGNTSSQRCYAIHEDCLGNEWLLTENGIGIIEHGSNFLEQHFSTAHTEQGQQAFYTIAEQENCIWLGSDNGRIWQYDKKEKNFILHQLPTATRICSINIIPATQELFITTEQEGFWICSPQEQQYQHLSSLQFSSLHNAHIKNVYIDSHSEVWLDPGRPQEVLHYNPISKKLKSRRVLEEFSMAAQTNPFFTILEDKNGILWIQPEGGGLCYYDRADDTLRKLFQDKGDHNYTNRVHSAYADAQGNLWVSTFSKGLDKFTFIDTPFEIKLFHDNSNNSLDNDVRCLFVNSKGLCFVGLRNGELHVYDHNKKYLGVFTENGDIEQGKTSINGVVYHMIEDNNGRLWMATKGDGLICAEPTSTGEYHIKRYRHSIDDIYSLSHNDLYHLHIDNSNRLWIATYGGGLNYLDLNNLKQSHFISHRNHLKGYPIHINDRVRTIEEDNNGYIWVGTTAGLLAFDSHFDSPDNITFTRYSRNATDKGSLSANDVHDILITASGEPYFATFGGGLCRLIQNNDSIQFETFTHTRGLPSDVLLSLIEDKNGRLWIGTENGLSKFDPQTGVFENYEMGDALHQPRFNEGTVIKLGNKLSFGCSQGLLTFNPDSIHKSNYIPPILFNKLYISNKEIKPSTNGILTHTLDKTALIELNHRQNIFTIQYAAIDMRHPQHIQYAYMLEGFDTEWNYVNHQQAATYTNLPNGKYTFKVRSTNSDGVWVDNERYIDIVILPSFWQTPWAWIIYVLILFLIISIIVYIFITIYRLKNEVSVEQQVSDIKLRFFTNISHELRTPLTLISGPVEHLLQNTRLDNETRSQLQLIEKNSNRMLRLVNQILDFRKIQNKKMHMRVSEIDIIPFVQHIMSSFDSLASEHHMQFDLQTSLYECLLWVDADKLDKILFNLISNAFKYTPQGKAITVFIEDKDPHIAIGVRDEGIGFTDSQRSKLFLRFENLLDKNLFNQPTTGIGLSLVKELVDMHHATIEVESKVGEGSCFTILLNKGRAHYDENVEYILYDLPDSNPSSEKNIITTSDILDQTNTDYNNSTHKNTILLIEDNTELLSFLDGIFSDNYNVLTANDGIEGLMIARKYLPDIIVSDLMMPNLDGIGLLKELHAELTTSHIPVILLTARSNIESKVEGLEKGADDYITKPFSAVYLKSRVENILQQRRTLRDFYRTNLGTEKQEDTLDTLSHVDGTTLSQNDRRFLENLLALMEKNMDNGDLVVDDFVKEMAVSRSVFFKKLKALTGMAPIEFIKEMRIKRAAQYIQQGEYTMTQIAYMVGINDPRYFSKCFKQFYNMTPTEYKEKILNKQ